MDVVGRREAELIRSALRDLPNPVRIVSYTCDLESWYSRAERLLLETIARSSDRVELEILAERWDSRREAEVGIGRTPAIVLRGDRDYGIRFYGLPDGYELETFLATIRAISERASGLSPRSRARLSELTAPVHLEVFASPT
jgi:alkyl hydroperoxide reductase subunit AhpF